MKLLMGILIMAISVFAYGLESSVEIKKASESSVFLEASRLFSEGKYKSTVIELESVELKLSQLNSLSKTQKGLIAYWKGISYNRNQDFPEAIVSFDLALNNEYSPIDLNYEYGQALFAAEKLQEARLQFRESLKKKFKRGVSLYYIAYISKEVGDKKKAVTFYKAIEKLNDDESAEVRQASEMQIGDIYLEEVEKQNDAFRGVEDIVLPQYRKALEVNRVSPLAPDIETKILHLERKYDLVLFKLRNGRPTLIPPYFLRAALEYGVDSNVTFAPTEQQIAESKKSSSFFRGDVMGRYTFYYKNFLSIAPEFRTTYTRYMNRVPEIYRNDNYVLAPAIRLAYEHTFKNKPAATLFDFDYNDARRDVNVKKKLDFAFRSQTLMLGERFNFFDAGESIVRVRRRQFDSYLSSADSHTTGLVYEQVIGLKENTLILYTSYDVTRVKDNFFDTDTLNFRGDLLLAPYKTWFTPTVGLGITRTNPVNNSARGIEYLINPSAGLSRVFARNLRGNLKFDYQNNKSDDKDNFAYKKYIYSFELEYIF